jgi:hypothetical protein
LSYVNNDISLAQESLEHKGMRRKAAAAAHDSQTMLQSLRRRTEAWKDQVQLYSYCIDFMMKIFRLFLQSFVRQELTKELNAENNEINYTLFLRCIPISTAAKLSFALNVLSTSGENFLNDDDDSHDILLRLSLYKESLLLWGECITLIYISTNT